MAHVERQGEDKACTDPVSVSLVNVLVRGVVTLEYQVLLPSKTVGGRCPKQSTVDGDNDLYTGF